jgi:hypothetical protein
MQRLLMTVVFRFSPVMRPGISTLCPLSALEARLLEAAAIGEELDCAPAGVTGETLEDVADWGRREIRSEVLGALCVGDVEGWDVHPRRGIRIRGARITGRLDLSTADLGKRPLKLAVCELPQGISLAQCSAGLLSFTSCTIADLDADELYCTSSLYLRGSKIGKLVLTDAHVRGLLCERAKFTNQDGPALKCDRLIAGGVFLTDVEAAGEVRLPGAQIGGQFSCERAKFTNQDGPALIGDGLSAGAVFLRDVEAVGEVRLPGAQIGGEFSCERAKFTNQDGPALHCDGLTTTGAADVFVTDVEAVGEVRLLGAQIGGQLACERAKFTNPNNLALNGDRLSAADVSLRGAVVQGEVSLVGAEIRGELTCTGAKISSTARRPALDAERLSAAAVRLVNVTATQQIRLLGAEIQRELNCRGAKLAGDQALTAEGCRIGGPFIFELKETPLGRVNLAYAKAGQLVDHLASWPKSITITGFSYDSLGPEAKFNVQDRIEWLRRNEPFSPDPYTQLQTVYRRFGNEADARKVGIAREDDLRRRGGLSWPIWIWKWFLRWSVGYGYRPWQALVPLLILLFIGALLYNLPAGRPAMVQTKDESPTDASVCPESYSCFMPLAYALDVLLPVVDLHQESKWLPADERPWGSWYTGLTWVLISSGWLLTSAVVGGMASILRKD